MLGPSTKTSFRHGVHPPPEKSATRDLPVRRFPFAPVLMVPLQQHAGKPAVAVVREGQEVARGELLAEPDGDFSVAMHAPASGTVRRIALVPTSAGSMVEGVYLEPLPASTQEVAEGKPCPLDATPTEILAAIQNAGIVGLGGAAFPTHVKLRVPQGRSVDAIIINGAECEPYLTTDHRVMLEQRDDILLGVRYLLRACGAERAILATESHSASAIEQINAMMPDDIPLETTTLQIKYPQGAEKILIETLLARQVPSGKLPMDVGAMCINVATTAEIGRLLPHGRGIQERVITISGPAVRDKGNYRIPIGTPLRFLLDQVGVSDDVSRVFLGGPMMGQAVASLDVPITKGTSGVVALTEQQTPARAVYPCIHCGYCVEACPLFLNPCQLGVLARHDEFETMRDKLKLFDCFECGACAYVCPSHLPLVQEFRSAKARLRRLPPP